MSFVILILTVIGEKMTLQCGRQIFLPLFMHKKYAVILKELDFALILPSTNGKQQIYHFEQII